jgi:5'-deoxynucleotidase YfbR-like HD superfamily hydrolase
MGEMPPRAWQRMLSGRRLNLLDPSPFDIELEDIAHGLARVARWNGQTQGETAYSVAQHALLVETLVVQLRPDLSPTYRLAALLHDASEYVIGDMISPFKAAIGGNYKAVEARLQGAIHVHFGLPPQLPKTIVTLIKKADKASAFLEATQLAGFSVQEAVPLFGDFEGFGLAPLLTPLPPTQVKILFMDKAQNLLNKELLP